MIFAAALATVIAGTYVYLRFNQDRTLQSRQLRTADGEYINRDYHAPLMDAPIEQPALQVDPRYSALRYQKRGGAKLHMNSYKGVDPKLVHDLEIMKQVQRHDNFEPSRPPIDPSRRSQHRLVTGGARAMRNPRYDPILNDHRLVQAIDLDNDIDNASGWFDASIIGT